MNKEFIVPTGRIIKEYLSENRVNQKDLSARIGISEKHISNVLNGNSRLTAEFALKLEKVLINIPASYWLNYECKYREYIARNEEEAKLNNIDLQEVSKKFKFQEVFGGLDLTPFEQAIEMLRLLKISDFNNFDAAYSSLAVDFMEDGGEKECIAIWLNLCESELNIQNSNVESIEYDIKQLENSLEKFKRLAFNKNIDLSISSCRKLCNKIGIYLVVCEAVTNSKVRGALSTFNDHPAIYLSGRYKSHDSIWFAFIHEIGHLLKHYNRKDIFISFEEDNSKINSKEEEANEFARDFFINPVDYEEFLHNNEITEVSIKNFAAKENVLSGIVVARLQHDKKIGYNQYSYLK